MKSPAQPLSVHPTSARWPTALAAVIIFAAVMAAYHNSFTGALVFDDGPAILENRTIRHLWPIWLPCVPPPDTTVSGRPLANFTLAVNYALSGTNVWSYHAFNLLIHILASLTLFGVVRRTLTLPARQNPGGGRGEGERLPRSRVRENAAMGDRAPTTAGIGQSLTTLATPIALVVTLLWSLHPLQVEAVTYVIQRVESLMALFFLLTFYCFVRGVHCRASRDQSTRRQDRTWWMLSVAACLFGVAIKEVIATAPLLVLLYDRTFVAGSFRDAWRQRAWYYLALAATWLPLAGLVASTGWDRNGTSGFDVGVTPTSYWLTQLEAIARYLGLSVWPHPLVFEYGTFWVRPGAMVPYALVVVPLVAGTFVALRRWPIVGFLGAWFFVILAPTSVMPGRIQMIVEHRMYLPLAAIIVLLVVGGAARWGRRVIVMGLVLAAGLGWLAERRNETYGSAITLWRDTVAKRPENARAFNCLGVTQFDAGQLPGAIESYQTALRLKPVYPEAQNNLGYALTRAGQLPEAIRHLEAALAMKPDYAIAHSNLGNALLLAGRLPDAIQHYEMALRTQPNDPKMHYNLGNALLQAGQISAAIGQYQAALQIDPESPDAQFNLGNALFRAGWLPAAVMHYRAALRLRPDYAEAHSNLGNALLQMRQVPEAIAEFQATLQINPNYAEGHNNLGAALFQNGRTVDAMAEFEAALRIKPDYGAARQNLERMRELQAAGAKR